MIEIEKTQNPNVMNFYTGKPLLKEGFSLYADSQTKTQNDFLQNVFASIPLKRVLLLPDMLFVEKEDEADFDKFAPLIMAFLEDLHITEAKDETLCLEKIEALIEARIRPFLIRDGGNIEIIDFNDGVLSVRFEGHCKGCPHADQTLKNVIEHTIKKYLPQVVCVQKEV